MQSVANSWVDHSLQETFLACDAFTEWTVALLPWCSSVCLPVCLGLGQACIV